MPDNWNQLSQIERAESILANVEGLTADDRAAIYDEWAQTTYADTVTGHIQAESDLQQIAVKHLMNRLGRGEELERYQNSRMQKEP